MKDKKHLSVTGVGPIYVLSIVLITILGRYLSANKILNTPLPKEWDIILIAIGVISLAIGVVMYVISV